MGNWALEAAAPVGLSSGAVSRVWFSADGASLYARLKNGKTLQTIDFESWKAVSTAPEPAASRISARNWQALTEYRGFSLVGGAPLDAAISPVDGDDLVVANSHGIWRSLDGGESWTSLNAALPNFPGRRILGLPTSGPGANASLNAGTRVLLEDGIREARWQPGERQAWRVVASEDAMRETALANALERILGARPARLMVRDNWVYVGVGSSLLVSSDGAATWRRSDFANAAVGAQVEAIFVVPGNPQLALASIGGATGTRLVRTMNGGIFWDDMTANLPAGRVTGVTADLETGAIYAASESGLFTMTADLRAAAPAGAWTRIATGSDAAVLDVALGNEGHQLWILLDKIGMRRALAPHRTLAPKVVSGADGTVRTSAPGGLLSVLGAKIAAARVGTVNVPVLAASDSESQLQLPFSVRGSSVTLSLEGARNLVSVALPLNETAPAIFTDGDGSPMLLDADRGTLVDTTAPARPGTTIQILATGLGRVTPDWPAGTPAPADAPPKVAAPVKAWLDRVPVEVTRATLAPGYVGLYLIEIEVPALVNSGPNELYLEMGQTTSNRVTLHVGR